MFIYTFFVCVGVVVHGTSGRRTHGRINGRRQTHGHGQINGRMDGRRGEPDERENERMNKRTDGNRDNRTTR